MSNTLQLISIQHELGMAIGLDLRLQPMLKQFTRVCIHRMGLAAVHYYFLQDHAGEWVLAENNNDAGYFHFLSIPDCSSVLASAKELPAVLTETPEDEPGDYYIHKTSDNGYIYYYRLAHFGYIALERLNTPLDTPVLELLKPIIGRLAISCQASFEHEQLLNAIEGRKKAEDTIVFQLFHDELTQLPNRRKLIETLEQDIARSRRHGYFGAALFIDLDRFKTVNDTLGHSAGDDLLKSVAKILTSIVRREDTVSRLSGDEFVVLLTELGNEKNNCARKIKTIIDKIRDAFAKPIIAGEHILHITPSIGIAIYPDEDLDTDQLLRHADTAMYQAKAHGPNTAIFYDSSMSAELESRLAVEKELQEAVKSMDQFELYYQPQYSNSDELIGAEALIRWNSPQRGQVPPALFIPVAEETGLMIEVGKWVAMKACEQLRSLELLGLPDSFKKLSINVSAVQFNQNTFVDDLLMIIRDSGINPDHLGIELTESTLLKSIEDTIEKMERLRSYGIHFLIDDFGTGYSSLSYLNRFPVECLKIDQAFVRNIHIDAGNRAIAETIIALANSLGLAIIAEGVETQDELECLNSLNCKSYQGYYFSRPIPFKLFCTHFLQNNGIKFT